MTTPHQARTDMEGVVDTVVAAWNALQSGTANDVTVVKDDTDKDAPVDFSPYCRVTIKHNVNKHTLADESMRRRYDRRGTMIVQSFFKFGDGFTLADAFVKLLADATEGHRTVNGVAFQRVRWNEVGKSGRYSQTNLVAEFQYDEIK